MRLWLAGRHWPLIAKRFRGMLEGLRVNWRRADAEARVSAGSRETPDGDQGIEMMVPTLGIEPRTY
jgi:hypothetical protein